MKNALLLTSFVLFFLLYACYDDPVIRFGFDTEFGKNSQGLTMEGTGSITLHLNIVNQTLNQ